MKKFSVPAALTLPALFTACAAPGPVVPIAPSVEVSQFQSKVITPVSIQFEGKVSIKNEMRGPLTIQRVDFGANLHDSPLFTDTFSELEPMRSRATQTVTLPFEVPMSTILDQAEDVLAEEAVRVSLHGTVFPEGFAPIPFESTVVIPMPRMPEVSIDGVEGSPLDGEFTVLLKVKNTNRFPVTFNAIDTYLNLNGKRHDLLCTDSLSQIQPGQACRVPLTMRKTRGKSLSMLVSVAKNQSADFTVGGSISCDTPHGLVLLPVELSSTAN